MNLNRLKRGFLPTKPEKGLHSLPGAIKSDRQNDGTSTIRVKGRYISKQDGGLGKAIGMLGYILGWISAGFLVGLTISAKVSELDFIAEMLPAFILGFAFVHGCALFADGLRGMDAPWARKGIILFWSGTLISIVLGVIL